MDVPSIFDEMPQRYRPGSAEQKTTFYFSIGDHKYTVRVEAESCTVEQGRTTDAADVVLKTTPELFVKMVVDGQLPGALDIARGRIRTNDPMGLQKLRTMFDFG